MQKICARDDPKEQTYRRARSFPDLAISEPRVSYCQTNSQKGFVHIINICLIYTNFILDKRHKKSANRRINNSHQP
jgi:hypothetical protein